MSADFTKKAALHYARILDSICDELIEPRATQLSPSETAQRENALVCASRILRGNSSIEQTEAHPTPIESDAGLSERGERDIPSMTDAHLLDLSHQLHHRVVHGGTQGPYLDKLNAELLRRLGARGVCKDCGGLDFDCPNARTAALARPEKG